MAGSSDLPGDSVDTMMATLRTNMTDDDSISIPFRPTVLSSFGVVASMSIGDQEFIGAKQQFIGLRLYYFPTQPDNGFPALEMIVRYTQAAPSNAAQTSSQ
jgi:hypothetical protein